MFAFILRWLLLLEDSVILKLRKRSKECQMRWGKKHQNKGASSLSPAAPKPHPEPWSLPSLSWICRSLSLQFPQARTIRLPGTARRGGGGHLGRGDKWLSVAFSFNWSLWIFRCAACMLALSLTLAHHGPRILCLPSPSLFFFHNWRVGPGSLEQKRFPEPFEPFFCPRFLETCS